MNESNTIYRSTRSRLRLSAFPSGKTYSRRGFNLIEMLIALAISAALLTATLVALDASFFAYQKTTEVASTHTIGRLAMHRMLTLVRTGTDFGPFPLNPNDPDIESDFIEFRTMSTALHPTGQIMALVWVSEPRQTEYTAIDYPITNALYIVTDPGDPDENIFLLIENVVQKAAPGDPAKSPFTLEYEKGRKLYRATIDLTIQPDDNQSLSLEGENLDRIRLVASAMPRASAY